MDRMKCINSLRPHICVRTQTILGSDDGLSPDRRQAIIWTIAGILLIGPLGTNFSEILIEILTFSFKKMRLKVSSAKRRPFCLGLNMLIYPPPGNYPLQVYTQLCEWKLLTWFNLIPAWISNYIHHKMRVKVLIHSLKFNGYTVESLRMDT